MHIAVASPRPLPLLRACLESLAVARRGVPEPPRVAVARPESAEDAAHLATEFPWVTLVTVPGGADVPRLRGAAMAAVLPGWVAVTEDHCVADPGWVAALDAAREAGASVVGGGMGNARPGPLNDGAFFSEYGFFSAARPPGEGFSLVTGANALYAPDVSARVAAWAAAGEWEDVIHTRLAAEGSVFRFVPGARVDQNARYTFGAFCRDRFEHGFDYARARLREAPDTSRSLRILTSPLLPLVLAGRIGRVAVRSTPIRFLASLPFTLSFLGAWSVGEAAGYWKGRAT